MLEPSVDKRSRLLCAELGLPRERSWLLGTTRASSAPPSVTRRIFPFTTGKTPPDESKPAGSSAARDLFPAHSLGTSLKVHGWPRNDSLAAPAQGQGGRHATSILARIDNDSPLHRQRGIRQRIAQVTFQSSSIPRGA